MLNMSSAFCQFFVDKIERIREDIRSATRLIHNVGSLVGRQYTGQLLSSFSDVTPDEVLKLINNMPNKSSPRDAMPTSLLKSCADVFSPIIARLANMSFTSGEFPSIYKTAQVLPLLKKPGLDRSIPANYRPISNLHTISKIIERLVLARLKPHLLASGNFNTLQSAYRTGNSTETALLRILDGLYKAIDSKQITVMISLDISAAFDTIN